MVSKCTSMVIKYTRCYFNKQTSNAIMPDNVIQIRKTINPFGLDRKCKNIPYEKLIMIAELLK